MGRVGRWLRVGRSHPVALDVLLLAPLCAATLIEAGADPEHHGGGDAGWVVTAAAVIAFGALLGRRRWPVAALVLTVIAATVFRTLTQGHGWVVLAPLIALYHLAVVTSDRRRLLFAGVLAALVLIAVPELAEHASGIGGSWLGAGKLVIATACGLALAAGDATRSRRAYLAEVEARAHRAEQDREREAERRVTEERLRIARDLHDNLGHHLALINAQAGMAGHVFDQQPDTARQSLTHITQTSRAALDDLRDTVGLLRRPGESAAPTEPAPGLAHLEELLASLRKTGMRIDRQVDGSARSLPAATDRTAYRVIQEALTNVAKHAPGAPARVELSFEPAALRIAVDNDANGAPARQPDRDGSRHGISGMRERVAAVDGTLEAGPRPDGGFEVRAVLPLPTGGPA